MSSLDLTLFRAINRDLSNAVFDVLMPVITDPQPFVVPLALIGLALCVWGGRKGRIVVGTSLVLLLATNGVNELIKLWVQRPRPCHALEAVRILVGCSERSFSFPSSHASNITSQALFFASFYRPFVLPLALVALAVGYSRIYVGVHYPTDVVGGALVGLACGACFIFVAREIDRRLPSRQPAADHR